mmetsp:Transcript_10520/g.64466  ORF Transcript_10520/g.64466 Transcript_10520/m.64466 type:complete len:222 (-) Transcript_10520:6474-7139(-)
MACLMLCPGIWARASTVSTREMLETPIGADTQTSTPLFLIARETSPNLGSSVKKRRKFGCGLTILSCPSMMPASLISNSPPLSRTGLSRSNTAGLHKFAPSRTTQCPCSIARVTTPSTHSNVPALPINGPFLASVLRDSSCLAIFSTLRFLPPGPDVQACTRLRMDINDSSLLCRSGLRFVGISSMCSSKALDVSKRSTRVERAFSPEMHNDISIIASAQH